MSKIRRNEFYCLLVISISILFWDTEYYFSNLRFLIVTIPIIVLYFKNDLFFIIKQNWKNIFIPTILILLHYFFFIIYADIKFNYLTIFKFLVFFLISISVFLSLKNFKQNFSFFINLSIILLSSILIYDFLLNLFSKNFINAWDEGRFENCYHGFFSQMSFVFKEESHFAMSACPLFLTSIFLFLEGKNKSNFIFILSVLIICFTIFFALSLTSIIGMILFSILSIILAKKKKTRIIFLFLIISLLTTLNFYHKCAHKLINITSGITTNLGITLTDNLVVKLQNRVKKKTTNEPAIIENVDSIKTSLSTGVYINSIKIAKNSFLDYPFGVGFDNYSFSFNSFTKKTSKETASLQEIIKDLLILNYNDGSNNFAKFSVEFGFLSIFFYIILVKFILNKQIDTSMKIFIISTLITQIFVRGAGYFNGGFLILYFFAFYFQKKINE